MTGAALTLVLCAAVIHATWNAMAKGARSDGHALVGGRRVLALPGAAVRLRAREGRRVPERPALRGRDGHPPQRLLLRPGQGLPDGRLLSRLSDGARPGRRPRARGRVLLLQRASF